MPYPMRQKPNSRFRQPVTGAPPPATSLTGTLSPADNPTRNWKRSFSAGQMLPSTLAFGQQADEEARQLTGGVTNPYGAMQGRIGSVQIPPIAPGTWQGPYAGRDPSSLTPTQRAANPQDPNFLSRPHQPLVGAGGAVADRNDSLAKAWDDKWGDQQGFAATLNANRQHTPWSMPSMLNGRPLNDMDKMRIAGNRARAGLSLDEQSGQLLAGAPASLGAVLKGPIPPQRPQASLASVFNEGGQGGGRDAVIARAQQKAAARTMRMGGVSSPLASVMTSGMLPGMNQQGGNDVRNLALGGPQFAGNMANIGAMQAANQGLPELRGAQAGLANAQAGDVSLKGAMMRDPQTRGDSLVAALASDPNAMSNPAIAKWVAGRLPQAPGQPSLAAAMEQPPAGFQAGEDDIAAGMNDQDAFAMNARSGDDDAIKDYARANKWPKWKLDKALDQYGQGLVGRVAGAAATMASPTELVGSPSLVGPPGNRRPPTKPAPRKKGLVGTLADSLAWPFLD